MRVAVVRRLGFGLGLGRVLMVVHCCAGDVNHRTLQKLLSRIDARGFERYAPSLASVTVQPPTVNPNLCANRSAQQLEFHVAFMKAAARVIYRADWETQKPMIMDKFGALIDETNPTPTPTPTLTLTQAGPRSTLRC